MPKKYRKSNYRRRRGRKHTGKRFKRSVRRIAQTVVNRSKETYRVDRFYGSSDGINNSWPALIGANQIWWWSCDVLEPGVGNRYVVYPSDVSYQSTPAAADNWYTNQIAAPILLGSEITRRNMIIRGTVGFSL